MGVSYATLTDVRTFGISVAQSPDPTVVDRLEVASRIVDDYTGMRDTDLVGGFAALTPRTVVLNDVRNAIAPIKRPFPFSRLATVSSLTTVTLEQGDGLLFGSGVTSLPVVVGAQAWAQPATVTAIAGDVLTLTGLVNLPAPGATVHPLTPVTVNGRALGSTAYSVEPWGLRLYISGFLDVDGFPRRSASDVSYGSRGYGSPFGSQVQVGGLFGYGAVPTPVRHATTLVAAFLLNQSNEMIFDPRVQGIAVEGYSIRFDNRFGSELIDTTGVVEADRLLRPYSLATVLVG